MPETTILEATVQSLNPITHPSCILKLREGLHVIYLDILMKELPILQHLLRPRLHLVAKSQLWFIYVVCSTG